MAPVEASSNVSAGPLAVDTETTGLGWYDEAFLVSFAERSGSFALSLRDPEELERAREMLGTGMSLVFHNAKFDLQKLILAGLLDRDNLPEFHDTEALAHLLDEHRSKRLKDLARDLLGLETDEADVIKAEKRKLKLTKDDGYDKLPRELVIPYAIKDAEYTLGLYEYLWPRLCRFPELVELYHQEMALTRALLEMEAHGMGVDVEYLEETAKEYAGEILKVELEIQEITGIEDPKFPNSPKQILEWFAEHGVELTATDRAALEAVSHPLGERLLALRKLRKIEGTYLRGLLKEQRDGIVHPWIRQHGTVTGRTSSGGYSGD